MKTPLIALAITGAVLAGTPAAAEEVSIRHNDLNIASAKDQRTLQQRIDIAARKVCGFHDHISGTRVRARETRRCYAQAKAQGMRSFAAIVAESHLGG